MRSQKLICMCLSILFMTVFVLGIAGAKENQSKEMSLAATFMGDIKSLNGEMSLNANQKLQKQVVSQIRKFGNSREKKSVIKANVYFMNPGITYERALGSMFSISLSANLIPILRKDNLFDMYPDARYEDTILGKIYELSPALLDVYLLKTTGIGGYITPKIYLGSRTNVPSGFFIGLPTGVAYAKESEDSKIRNVLYIGSAIGPGYQFIFPSGLSFEFALTMGVNFARFNLDTGGTEFFAPEDLQLLHMGSASVGYAF